MPAELKVVFVFNAIATVAIVVLVALFGGGSALGLFAPDEGVEIKMVRIGPPSERQPASVNAQERLEIPSEYRSIDLSPRPWVILADGTVRFDGADSR